MTQLDLLEEKEQVTKRDTAHSIILNVWKEIPCNFTISRDSLISDCQKVKYHRNAYYDREIRRLKQQGRMSWIKTGKGVIKKV